MPDWVEACYRKRLQWELILLGSLQVQFCCFLLVVLLLCMLKRGSEQREMGERCQALVCAGLLFGAACECMYDGTIWRL